MRVGDVLHMYVPVLHGDPKHKFVVLVCCDAPMRYVLINSENAAEVLQNARLQATQVQVDAARHDFLKYDSWIDAHDLFGTDEASLVEALEEGGYRGRLASDLLAALKDAISESPTIAERQKRRTLDAIDAELITIADGQF